MRRRFFVAAVGLLTAIAVNLASLTSEAEAGRRQGRRARNCGTARCSTSTGCYQGGCNTGCAPAAAPAQNGYQNAAPPAPAAPGSPSDLNSTPPAPGV